MEILKGPNDPGGLRICPKCRQYLYPGEGEHFVPPSLGESGFWLCNKPDKYGRPVTGETNCLENSGT